ncbi:MAG: hypothetical protein QNJ26_00200 [Desulfobacterales bacterium]|nr:hypothetical protein [Desulfobacterales bacterium]
MNIKRIIFGIALVILSHASVGFTQDEALSEDDLEVIQILEILENLDLLEEDLDLLDTMTDIGEDDDS